MTEDALNMKGILFAFPKTRQRLPKDQTERILLWHSCVIYLIWKRRYECIQTAKFRSATLDVDLTNFGRDLWIAIKYALVEIH